MLHNPDDVIAEVAARQQETRLNLPNIKLAQAALYYKQALAFFAQSHNDNLSPQEQDDLLYQSDILFDLSLDISNTASNDQSVTQ
jgi:hypothetical protein